MSSRDGGAGFCPGGASLPYRFNRDVVEKNLPEILGIFGIWLTRMAQWEGSAFCCATNRATGQTPGVSTANSRKAWLKLVGELSIARTDFDYHRTNDGHRDGDEPAPPGSSLLRA